MIQATVIHAGNVGRLALIYNEFAACAQDKYRWDIEPIDFATMKMAIAQGIIQGIMVEDSAEAEPVAMMLYRLEPHRAIEINVIYLRPEAEPEQKTIVDRMMRLFIETVKKLDGWEVISYAMLGAQEKLIRTITWYGFKPLGQAILKFNVMDQITLQILMQQKLPDLPEGYRLDCWRLQYADGVATTLYEAFSKAADALWDPRFRSEGGTQAIVEMLSAGEMGRHMGDCTTIILKDDVPVGVCFLLEANLGVGNVPLVAVRPSEKGKGFGNLLLKTTLDNTIKAILDGKFGMLEINATMETDNLSAIKMYRRMGFVEEYNYPHVYLEADKAKALAAGTWCTDGGGMA